MQKLILTDLDGTLVNKNLEREFLLYFLISHKFRYRKFINLGYYFLSKIFSNSNNIKYFYYDIPVDYVCSTVDGWLKNSNFSELKINKDILNLKSVKDKLFVLTNCPSFISIPFCSKFFSKEIEGVFATEIYKLENRFHFRIKRRVLSNYKKIIAQKLINYYPYKSFGYGDSKSDKYFISLCDNKYQMKFF